MPNQPMTRRLIAGLVFGLAWLGVAAWVWLEAPAPPARLTLAPDAWRVPPVARTAPVFHRDWLNEAGTPPSVHAGSLVQLPDGDLVAAWFGGSREGAADVAIWMARYDHDKGAWSRPWVSLRRAQVARALGRGIRKLGNPVLAVDGRGRLVLFVVTVSVGGWAGSSITVLHSPNGGRNWTRIRRLATSPFLNVSTLVKAPPLPLADGGWLLPVYHELIHKRGEVLWLDADMRLRARWRIGQRHALLQPWLVALDEDHVLAFLRRAGDTARVFRSRSGDGGLHWTPPRPTDAPNPNAAVAVLRRPDGSLLMAANPEEGGRDTLALLLSTDQGRHWRRVAVLEHSEEDGAEFSYPWLMRDRAGDYHLVYTWQRRRMRHVRFNEAWLAQRIAATEMAR